MTKKIKRYRDEVDVYEFINLINELGLKDIDACRFAGISPAQFWNWKKKGKMPAKNFWAFQKELVMYFEKEKLRKLVMLKVIDKEFLRELIDE